MKFARPAPLVTAYRMTLNFLGPGQQTEITMTHKNFTTILTLPLLAGVLSAEMSKTQALLMAMGANAKKMAPYQWKQKTTIVRHGDPAAFKIEEVHIDPNGQPARITIAQSQEKRMGPLRARKAADVKDDVQEVMHLAGRYASPQQLSQAIQRGEIWEGPGTLRVQTRSVILPMDEMTMTVNAVTHLATRVEFKTLYEGSPVTIVIDYQQLPNGPSMLNRMTVQIPKDNITVNVESYGFVRLAMETGQ